jgi:hypothetical protein
LDVQIRDRLEVGYWSGGGAEADDRGHEWTGASVATALPRPHRGESERDWGKEMDMTCGPTSSVKLACYPGRDSDIPGEPNRSKVENRPGFDSLRYQF